MDMRLSHHMRREESRNKPRDACERGMRIVDVVIKEWKCGSPAPRPPGEVLRRSGSPAYIIATSTLLGVHDPSSGRLQLAHHLVLSVTCVDPRRTDTYTDKVARAKKTVSLGLESLVSSEKSHTRKKTSRDVPFIAGNGQWWRQSTAVTLERLVYPISTTEMAMGRGNCIKVLLLTFLVMAWSKHSDASTTHVVGILRDGASLYRTMTGPMGDLSPQETP
ncbi:hypothetical protein Scep_029598 [Stephania cephalantha]|uniref:Uncharacterized protein n=1 Tax=Stephania cephalantha TaxID=152367 RepID=A0AAP0HFS0_9MAGN